MIQNEVRVRKKNKNKGIFCRNGKTGWMDKIGGNNTYKIKWGDMLKVEPFNLQFTLKSVYNLLPIPVNLKVWNKQESDQCYLC
jgi:hypothetical protein